MCSLSFKCCIMVAAFHTSEKEKKLQELQDKHAIRKNTKCLWYRNCTPCTFIIMYFISFFFLHCSHYFLSCSVVFCKCFYNIWTYIWGGRAYFTHLYVIVNPYTNSVGVYLILQGVLLLSNMSIAVTVMFSLSSNLCFNISQKPETKSRQFPESLWSAECWAAGLQKVLAPKNLNLYKTVTLDPLSS